MNDVNADLCELIQMIKRIARLEYIVLRALTRFFLGKKRRDKFIKRKVININSLMHKHFLDSSGIFLKPLNKEEAYTNLNKKPCIVPFDAVSVVNDVRTLYLKPSQGDVVIDAGAHYGFYTLLASKLAGSEGTVLAFEPHPTNYKRLLLNLLLTKAKNVKAFNVALGESSRQAKLYLAHSGEHSITPELSDCSFYGYFYVQVTTIDKIVRELGIDKISLMKIDTEGAELSVLKGAFRTIQNCKPKITIASYHYPNEAIEIKEWLKINFPFYNVKIEKHRKQNFLQVFA